MKVDRAYSFYEPTPALKPNLHLMKRALICSVVLLLIAVLIPGPGAHAWHHPMNCGGVIPHGVCASFLDETKIQASDPTDYDAFGISIAIDGDTALVGAPFAEVDGSSEGAAYVLEYNGSAWNEKAKLTASNGESGARFGYSVALDGNTALVGAYGTRVNGQTTAGAAYIYERIGGFWGEKAVLTASDNDWYDHFGQTVALDGDTALIGAPYASVDDWWPQGAVYAFEKDVSTWNERTKLSASDGASSDGFGMSLALDGDTALIGGVYSGSAYVFEHDGTAWEEQTILTASDGFASFGRSVDLDGDTAIVGATIANVDETSGRGAAYVYERDGSTWTQQVVLSTSDGDSNDVFGTSVTLDGDMILVGSPRSDEGENENQGSVYVYKRDGSAWPENLKLTASDGGELEYFGGFVTIDNETAAVYARARTTDGAHQGAVYVYQEQELLDVV